MKNDSLNDIAADVRDTARQLAAVDFSTQSQMRDALRARLMNEIGTQSIISPRMTFRPQPRGLYAVIGTLAASLILGMILIMQSNAPTPLTEQIIAITPAAQLTDIPFEALPQFYERLAYASAAVQKPLFAPSALPEGYSLSFVALSSPAPTVRIMTSVYVDKTAWQKTVLRGLPDNDHVDYLYIAQELTNEETHAPQWNFPSDFPREESTFYTNDPQGIDTGYYYGTAKAGDYHIVIWPKAGSTFHLASRVMSYEELQQIAESLQPLSVDSVFIAEQGALGSCDISGEGEGTSSWIVPLPKDSYTLIRGLSSGHAGIDLEAVINTPVYAANSGTVVFAGLSKYGTGNTIVISHGDILTLYGHLNTVNVNCGEEVQSGQTIGAVGSTGNSSGPHLHFEMIRSSDGGTRIDPAEKIDF